MKPFIGLLLLLFALHLRGQTNSVTLEWNPSGTTNVAGYRLYYGVMPGAYSTNEDVGNVTNYTVTGLTAGINYYFAATAYQTNDDGIIAESVFSNEAEWRGFGRVVYLRSP